MAAAVRKDLPLLGICLGGQMLAKVLGAQVRKNNVREIGIYKARLTEEGKADRLFAGFQDEFDVFHWHNDTFKISHGATFLAEGKDCRNQAFRKGNAVGLQFHVEPLPEEIPLWCDEYRDELVAENKTKDEIVGAFRNSAEKLKHMSFRLMQNFLG
jgi:GMP synthase-like glutamine amidotransferase